MDLKKRLNQKFMVLPDVTIYTCEKIIVGENITFIIPKEKKSLSFTLKAVEWVNEVIENQYLNSYD